MSTALAMHISTSTSPGFLSVGAYELSNTPAKNGSWIPLLYGILDASLKCEQATK